MAKKKESNIGSINVITAFVIALLPLIVGFSMTGGTIGIPLFGILGNLVLGWFLVLVGLFSVYLFFAKQK